MKFQNLIRHFVFFPLICFFHLGNSSETVSLNDFFSFGSEARDQLLQDSDMNLTSVLFPQSGFPFFNHYYSNLWINSNGTLSFRLGNETTDPLDTKSNVVIDRNNSKIVLFRNNITGGNLFYRISQNSSDLSKATLLINESYPKLEMEYALIATWVNVTLPMDIPFNSSPSRSTFQLILTTDGVNSFSLLLYPNNISRAFETNYQEDPKGNETIQSNPADLTKTGTTNINGTGKLIFKLYNNHYAYGFKTYEVFEKVLLSISPAFIANGGEDIIGIRIPQLENNTQIQIVFKKNSHRIPIRPVDLDWSFDYQSSIISLRVPYLHGISGSVDIILITKDAVTNLTKFYKGTVYLRNYTPKLYISMGNYSITRNQIPLNINWDPSEFLLNHNLSINYIFINGDNEALKISEPNTIRNDGVYKGYLNMNWMQGKMKQYEEFFEKNITEYFISLSSLLNDDNRNSKDILLNLNSHQSQSQKRVRRSSKNILDNIFRKFPNIQKFSENAKNGDKILPEAVGQPQCLATPMELTNRNFLSNAMDSCINFQEEDPGVDLNSPGIEPCPPTTALAKLDSVRFILDWHLLFMGNDNPKRNDVYVQRIPAPGSGSRNRCVYDSDGNLITKGPRSGSVDAASNWDDHKRRDVDPWCNCCKWTNMCEVYREKRPTDDGSRYKAPEIAKTIGDPHITTFDGKSYIFNGHCEFWMIYPKNGSSGLKLQARMEPLRSRRATIATAYVVNDGVSNIQVDIYNGRLRVLLDGAPVPFPSIGEEVFETQNSIIKSNNGATVKLVSDSGFVFTFTKRGRNVNLIATKSMSNISDKNESMYAGLLGNLDSMGRNDFELRNGTILPENSNNRAIHFDFGLSWMTSKEDSLFTYGNGMKRDSYCDSEFIPNFDPPLPPSKERMRNRNLRDSFCGNSTECLFDFLTSDGDVELANGTRIGQEEFEREQRIITDAKSPQVPTTTLSPEIPNSSYIPSSIPIKEFRSVRFRMFLYNLKQNDEGTTPESQWPDPYLKIYLKGHRYIYWVSGKQYQKEVINHLELFHQSEVCENCKAKGWNIKRPMPYFLNDNIHRGQYEEKEQSMLIEVWESDVGKEQLMCSIKIYLDAFWKDFKWNSKNRVQHEMSCGEAGFDIVAYQETDKEKAKFPNGFFVYLDN